MADGLTLQGALGGMTVSPMENYYGIGTQALGQALPGLVNPYGNFGTNLTYVLGGALLQGLLGYQARQEANRQNLEIGKLAAQMTAMPSAADRVNFLSGIDVDSQVMGKLTNLQSALQQQDVMSQAAIQQQIAQKKALAPIELQIKQAQDRGMTLEEYANIQPVLEQVRAQRLAQALSTAKTPEEVTAAAEKLTASDLVKRAEALRPTSQDALILSPTELKQKQEQYDSALSQARALTQLEREERVGQAQIRESREKVKNAMAQREQQARTDKIHVEVADRLRESNALLRLSEQAMASNDPVIVQKLIKASEKPIEQNAVTLGEFNVIKEAQPIADRAIAELKKQLGQGSGYDPKVVQALRDYLKNVNLVNEQLYDQQVAQTAKAYKIDDPESIRLVTPATAAMVRPVSPNAAQSFIFEMNAKYGANWRNLMNSEDVARGKALVGR